MNKTILSGLGLILVAAYLASRKDCARNQVCRTVSSATANYGLKLLFGRV